MTPLPSMTGLFLRFCLFSLMAVGGANTLIPEMHRYVVDVNGWMSSTEFAALFAITQAAPGPNVLIVSVLGLKLAGLPGALICTAGMCGPAAFLAFQVGRLWDRYRDNKWRHALERGLAPVTVGLVFGSGCLLAQASAIHWPFLLITLACTVLTFRLRANPLWWLSAAACCGLLLPA